jgi:hypothetical protein
MPAPVVVVSLALVYSPSRQRLEERTYSATEGSHRPLSVNPTGPLVRSIMLQDSLSEFLRSEAVGTDADSLLANLTAHIRRLSQQSDPIYQHDSQASTLS